MFSTELSEDEARRVAFFFVDLMATLTTDEVGDDEVTALLRSIWSNRPAEGASNGEADELDLTAGFVQVAVAMAHMMVQERRTSGQLDASVSDVWSDLREFMTALRGR